MLIESPEVDHEGRSFERQHDGLTGTFQWQPRRPQDPVHVAVITNTSPYLTATFSFILRDQNTGRYLLGPEIYPEQSVRIKVHPDVATGIKWHIGRFRQMPPDPEARSSSLPGNW
ncbi:hypothetical protein PCASD_26765 [Puccinia coronata f. sp. avenae]|nr:hypothetical protein PCASD_26765 [Puccinia coronata f. sp. avenae]